MFNLGNVSNNSSLLDESDASSNLNTSQAGIQDMFGGDIKTKGKPMKGYKFLIFTIIMIIALSVIVIVNTPDIQEIEDSRIKEDQQVVKRPDSD